MRIEQTFTDSSMDHGEHWVSLTRDLYHVQDLNVITQIDLQNVPRSTADVIARALADGKAISVTIEIPDGEDA